MSTYHRIWLIAFVSTALLIFGCIIYGSITTDKWYEIKDRLNNMDVDQIDYMLIAPDNIEWNVNLTIDTIRIVERDALEEVVTIINQVDTKYPGRALGREWEAYMYIHFKNEELIKLELINSVDGFFIRLTNVMGLQLYYCNELKDILERYVEYKYPVGG